MAPTLYAMNNEPSFLTFFLLNPLILEFQVGDWKTYRDTGVNIYSIQGIKTLQI